MISDESVSHLLKNALASLTDNLESGEALSTQFFRGIGSRQWENQHPGSCNRHMSVFNRFNAIPEYCFSCYKVSIKPGTVVELLKLMLVFEKLELPNDNTRKCLVECRENIPGTYTGLIYCRDLDDGKNILASIVRIMNEQIGREIPATLKRGCSEYAVTYPDFADPKSAMRYPDEWREYEDIIDNEFDIATQAVSDYSYNQPELTLHDAKVMLAWLRYAATIGDTSYEQLTGFRLPPFEQLHRPPHSTSS